MHLINYPKIPSSLLVCGECRFDSPNYRLYWSENESKIASILGHRESNLKFTLITNKDQRKKFAFELAFAQCKRTLTFHRNHCVYFRVAIEK